MENEMIYLPEDFISEMEELLGSEIEDFKKSYESNKYVGLRRNCLKASKEVFEGNIPFKLEPVDWAAEGYYYDLNEHPGRTPLHEAGAFYIQEPSAMSAVALLDPKPGDYVLDLCAAPGGKSTQIAGRLQGEGLLVSNEIVKNRAGILSQNIERMGVRNALVLNETAGSLSGRFLAFFDKILVDAPCSGEGMFKKEENALLEWSLANVEMCHARQLEILEEAAKMLKAGGILTYSTCTFNKLENEGTVEAFLKTHPEFTLEKTERFWPHKVKGEGHFVARFIKAGELSERTLPIKDIKKGKADTKADLKTFLSNELGIIESTVSSLLDNRELITFGDNLYLLPEGIADIKGLKVERPGLHVAVNKKNRFEPAHSLALALNPSDVKCSLELSDSDALKYIKGETLNCDPSIKGWVLLTTRGFSIGFGKASQGIVKNHYPKGLRK